ncbi:MAG: sugar phosphate nucleotidyltransferase [Candidatus Odinarchaeota archaeon]
MKAFILCAGKGTRLLPLTESIPKPLLPLLDKPLLDHVIDMLLGAGITEFGVVIDHLKEQFYLNYPQKGYTFIEQGKQAGTGHAVQLLEEYVMKDEPFLVAAGDNLFPPYHVRKLIERIKESGVDGVVSLIEMPPSRIINQMATVRLGEDHQILEIKEKPASEKEVFSLYGTAAIWVFKNSIFPAMKRSSLSSRGELEIQSGIQSLIDQGKVIKGVPLPEENYIQLTSLEDLYNLNMHFLERQGLTNLIHDSVIAEEGTKIRHSIIMSGCKIKKGVTLDKVVALPGTRISSSVSRSLIHKDRVFTMQSN